MAKVSALVEWLEYLAPVRVKTLFCIVDGCHAYSTHGMPDPKRDCTKFDGRTLNNKLKKCSTQRLS